jgi:hypothetical protein
MATSREDWKEMGFNDKENAKLFLDTSHFVIFHDYLL